MKQVHAAELARPPLRYSRERSAFRRAVLSELPFLPGLEKARRTQRLKTLGLGAALLLLIGLADSGSLEGGWLFTCIALTQPLSLIAAMGIAHDASHGALSKRPSFNRLGTHLFDALGVSSYIWRFDHVGAHHAAPNVSLYDANLTSWGVRLDPRTQLRWYHTYQHLYAPVLYSLASLFKVFAGDFLAITRGRARAHLPSTHSIGAIVRLVAWKTFALALTLALPLVMNADWTTALFGYVAGHLIAGLLMGAVFQPTHTNEYVRWPSAPPDGRLAHTFEENALATTADFCVESSFVTWISGGLNIHAVHHMFPRLPHHQLPQASRLVAAVAQRHGLRYATFDTWASAILSHLRALARLGRTAPEDVPEDGDIFRSDRVARDLGQLSMREQW